MAKRIRLILGFLSLLIGSLHQSISIAKEPPEIKYSIPDNTRSLQKDYLARYRSFLETNSKT